MSNKIYTAQKMREMAECISNIKQSEMPSWKEGAIITGGDLCRSAEMLRQAADTEEENSDLRRRLKVAEDALGESRVAICHICDQKHMCGHGTAKFDPCCICKDIVGALAAIQQPVTDRNQLKEGMK